MLHTFPSAIRFSYIFPAFQVSFTLLSILKLNVKNQATLKERCNPNKVFILFGNSSTWAVFGPSIVVHLTVAAYCCLSELCTQDLAQ